jgi:hypothetical protein
VTPAADKAAEKDEGKVAGILIDKNDNAITVKADGEDEPIKYLVGDGSNKKVAEALKSIFNASRVQLTYKKDGDARQLVSIKKQILRDSGTVTGLVVKVYNDFWVEVKPKDGLADAYAPGANYNDKEFMAKLKGLKPGDSVTLTFTTDGERHRIHAMRINATAAPKEGKVVAGILIDKNDNALTVKADGEEEPVKYLVGKDADKKLVEALKSIFGASRVQLTYKKDGDARQLVSIKKQILKESGTVTGTVVKVYDDFWVEVKPKNGLADAYAPGANYKDKDFMARLKGLKKGDSVTITFNTDGERHRILTLRTNDEKPK